MKKIDVHVHTTIWENLQNKVAGEMISPQKLRETYAAIGIEKGIIMPLTSPESRISPQSNEEMEYIASKYPDTFFWCCSLDPRSGKNNTDTDFSVYLNYYKERGAVGVGELTANLHIDDPLMDNFFYHCAKCDMPVTIHIAPEKYGAYGIIDDLHLPRLEKMLKKYPDLKIIGHSQCFWSEMGTNVDDTTRSMYVTGKVVEGRVPKLMRAYPNLYCDLSAGSGFNALKRDPDFAYKFMEEFSDRIMFGTDICGPGADAPLSKWLDDAQKNGHISEKTYAKICRENAISIFKLDKKSNNKHRDIKKQIV